MVKESSTMIIMFLRRLHNTKAAYIPTFYRMCFNPR